MKYKLIKLLPFENSPKIGYISEPHCTQKDGAHYWNGLWFNPENYPEFWEKVVEKAKQPLFTTEDGVDIFENNTSIYILDKFTIRHIKHKDFNVISKHVKYFSTKEKAEEYILMNKPCLSLKEIKETTTIKGLSLKKLEKLVKSKIQQSV